MDESGRIIPLQKTKKIRVVQVLRSKITLWEVLKLQFRFSKAILDQTIESMTQRNVKENRRQNMISHIEGKHNEGVSHPCGQCGKYFSGYSQLSTTQKMKY